MRLADRRSGRFASRTNTFLAPGSPVKLHNGHTSVLISGMCIVHRSTLLLLNGMSTNFSKTTQGGTEPKTVLVVGAGQRGQVSSYQTVSRDVLKHGE